MICELTYSVVVCPAAAAIVARRMDDFIAFAHCAVLVPMAPDLLFSYQDTRKWEKKRLIEIRSPCLSRGDGGGGGCDHFSRSGRTQRSRAE